MTKRNALDLASGEHFDKEKIGLFGSICMLLWAYTLVLPVPNNVLLTGAFAGIGVGALAAALTGKFRLDVNLYASWLLITTAGLIGSIVGINSAGVGAGAVIYIAIPTLFFIIVSVATKVLVKAFLRTLLWVSMFLSLVIALYVASSTGLLPQVIPSSVLEVLGAGFGALGDATQIRLYGLSTLVAAGPLWAISLCYRRASLLPGYYMRVLAVAMITLSSIVAGRRALVVVMMLALVLAFVGKALMSSSRRSWVPYAGFPIVVIVAVLLLPRVLELAIVSNTLSSIGAFFRGETSDSAADQSSRAEQAVHLIGAWQSSPILGHGFGATINGYVRHFEGQPWAFEMQYHMMLLQLGLLGTGLVATGVFLALRFVLQVYRANLGYRPVLAVCIAGALAMFIGNATNPYLQAPGHFWAIFLPVAAAAAVSRIPVAERQK